MNSSKISIGVLGAGITGLSIAWNLKKKGFSTSVYEKEAESGGVIKSERTGKWLLEHGPNTLMVRSRELRSFFEELDLKDQLLTANRQAKKRYIVRDGKLVPLPLSVFDFLKTDLLSGKAKLKLLREPFVKPSDKSDESISSFFRRRLGNEVLNYIANPFIAGIYAGDPDQLSVKHTLPGIHELEQHSGSLAKGLFKKNKKKKSERELISFREGLQTLPRTLGRHLGKALKLSHEIKEINKNNGKWVIQFDNMEETRHDIIVSALPAYVLEQIFSNKKNRRLWDKINSINYVPMSVLHLGYKNDRIGHPLDGFGMLIPEIEDYNILGSLFSSTLFPDRAPQGYSLLTLFAGGARNPELAHLPTEEIIPLIEKDIRKLLNISGDPDFIRHTYWNKAIPQYETNYDTVIRAVEKIENSHPGLFIAGNYRDGVAVPDRISIGFETAEKIALFINR